MDRRNFLRGGFALATGTALASCGGGGGGGGDGNDAETSGLTSIDSDSQASTTAQTPLTAPAQPKARVIVIGGGMAGVTAAKYLRLWGDAVDVTLVAQSPTYTSCILSSLVLTGQRTLSSLEFGYTVLRDRYGVRMVFDTVTRIDPVTAQVTLASGGVLAADRIVLAPGIDFDAVAGLTDPLAMPHAWKAGPQTTAAGAATGGHAVDRGRRTDDPEGSVPLPARTLRAGLPARRLDAHPQAGRQADRAGCQPGFRHREGQLRAGVLRPARQGHRVPHERRPRPCRYRPVAPCSPTPERCAATSST